MPIGIINDRQKMKTALEQPSGTERNFHRWFLASVLVVNVALYACAAIDRSMLGFYICVSFGPTLNGVLIVAGILAAILVRRKHREFRLPRELTLAIGAPALAAVILGSIVLWYIRSR